MAKTPFTHSLTPEQKAQLLKAREHSLGSADNGLPTETSIAWEIQLKAQPTPAQEIEPVSAPHAPSEGSITPASQQPLSPLAPDSSTDPAEQPLSPVGASTPPLPAEGYIQAPNDPDPGASLVSNPAGPIASHSVQLDSSDQHPGAHAIGGGAAGGKAAAAASQATTSPSGVTSAPTTFQVQGSSGQVKEDLQLQAQGTLTVSGQPNGQVQWDVASRQGLLGSLDIDQNGQWHYLLDNANPKVQALSEGQQVTERFLVFATDASGVTRAVHLLVQVNGSNDRALIAGTPVGTVKEDDQLHTGGKLTVTDPDAGQAEFVPMSAAHGAHGTFSIAPDGTWTYSLNNAQPAVQALKDGDQLTDTLTVSSKDGTTQQITVTINGRDDQAQIAGTAVGTVKEDDQLHTGGKLTVTDPDAGQAEFVPMSAAHGAHGTFSIAPDGTWTYALNNAQPAVQALKNGDQLTDTLTVSSKDGTTQQITVTINGRDDQAQIAGTAVGTVKEDDQPHTGGKLTVTDPDAGQAEFVPMSAAQGAHGTFTIAPDGTWTYALDNAQPAVQALKDGDQLTDTLTVSSKDGTTQQITVIINGRDDQARITGTAVGTVKEDDQLHTGGKLTVTDPDAGQAEFVPMSAAQGAHGTFTIAPDGTWTYALDNAQPAVQALKDGDQLTDTLTVSSKDGTTHTITVTLHGTNDAPVVSGSVTLAAGREDTDVTLTKAELLAHATDVDQGETALLNIHNLVADHGTITDNHDGTYTFHPAKDYNGPVSFSYEVQDPQGASTPATASLDLAAVRDAAVIGGQDTGAVKEDTAVSSYSISQHQLTASGSLTIQDPDAGQDHFQFTPGGERAVSDLFGGHLNMDQRGNWEYFVNNDNPALQALKEGQTQDVVYQVRSEDGTTHRITITVTGTNDAPQVSHAVATQTATEDAAFSFKVPTGTFTDIDTGDPLTLSTGTLPAWLHFDPATGTFSGTPANSDVGTTQVTVTATDGSGAKVSTTFDLHVANTNDAPTLNPIASVHTTEDGAQVSGHFTATDPDTGDTLSFSTAAHIDGLSINTDGSWSFDPSHASYQHLAAGEVQTLTIPVTVTDAAGATSSQNLVIEVTGTNDGALITGTDTGRVIEDFNTHPTTNTLYCGGRLAVSDVDTGQNHFSFQSGPGSAGLGSFMVRPDGSWGYTVDNNAPGVQSIGEGMAAVDKFTVRSADGTEHTITVTIVGRNDAPVVSHAQATVSWPEDQHFSFTLAHDTFTDVDAGDTSRLSVTTSTLPAWLHFDPSTYTFSGTPGNADVGTQQITVTATDGHGAKVDMTFDLVVNNTNDAPTLNPIASVHTTEDGAQVSGHFTATDPDTGDTLSFSTAAHIDGLSINTDGSWSFDPSHASYQHLAAGEVQTLTIPVTVTDAAGATGTQNLVIQIAGSNDGAHITGTDTGSIKEDVNVGGQNYITATGQLHVDDVDQGEAHFQAEKWTHSIHGQYGQLNIGADGAWDYRANTGNSQIQALGEGKTLTDTLTVHTADGSPHQIVITIHGTNDAPVASASSLSATEDTVYHFKAADFGFSDVDGDTLHHITFTEVPYKASQGVIMLNGHEVTAGTQVLASDIPHLEFHPALNSNRQDTYFKFSANDGHTDSVEVRSHIGITPVNDAPTLSVQHATPATGTLVGTDVDPGDTYTFSVAQGTGHFGTLTVNTATGAYTYTPQTGVHGMVLDPKTGTYSGTDTFAVTVTDQAGTTDTQYITFTPTASLSAPTQPGGQPSISTSVPANPTVSATAPTATTPATAPTNSVTIDLAAASDSGISNTDNYTSDNTPHITGTTAIPFSKVEILEGGKVIASTISDAGGHYSVDAPTLIDGAHSLSAQATGPAETTATLSAALSLTIDTAAPVVSIALDPIAGNDVLNAAEAGGTVTITGTVGGEYFAGNQVQISVNGKHFTGTPDANGHFAIDVPGTELKADDTHLGGFTHAVQATIAPIDLADNWSRANATRGYAVDATAPVPTLSIDAVATDNVLNAAEAGKDIAITGTVAGDFSAGDTVTLSVNGKDFTGTVSAQGKFSIDVPGADLKADPNTQIDASVSTTDAAGNAGTATATHSYTVDTTLPAPTLHIDSVTTDDVLNAAEAGRNVAITGTVAGEFSAGDTVTLSVNGKAFTGALDAHGQYSIDVPGADLKADANTQIEGSVTATDAAGNNATAMATHVYTIDTAEPSLSIWLDHIVASDSIVNSAEASGDIPITGRVSGEFSAGDIVTLSVNGKDFTGAVDAAGKFSIDVPGADLAAATDHRVHVVANHTDAAGNVGWAGIYVSYQIDVTAPVPTIAVDAITADNILNAAEAGSNVNVTGTVAGEFNAGDTVTLTVGGQTHTGTLNAAGRFSIGVPGSELQGGTSVQASVTTTDAAGNSATVSASHGYSVDTSNAISSLSLSSNTDTGSSHMDRITSVDTPTINGRGEAGSTVVITDEHGTSLGQVTVYNNGGFSFASPALTEGTHTLTFTSTDAAGNVASTTLDVTIDKHNALTVDLSAGSDSGARGDGLTSNTRPILEGQTDAGAKVEITDAGGHQLAWGRADASGHYSLIPRTPLAEGAHTLTITSTDDAGNVASSTRTVTIDTRAQVQDVHTTMVEDSSGIHGNLVSHDEAGVAVVAADVGEHQGNYGQLVLQTDGTYTYTPDARIQALSAGEHQHDSFTFSVTDPAGNVASKTFDINITGANDGATFSGTLSGAVREDNGVASGHFLETSGTAVATDVDGQSGFQTETLHGSHGGVLTINAAGNWHFSVDNNLPAVQQLGPQDSLVETFTVHSADGTAQDIAVTIHGTIDAPTLSATQETTQFATTDATAEAMGSHHPLAQHEINLIALSTTQIEQNGKLDLNLQASASLRTGSDISVDSGPKVTTSPSGGTSSTPDTQIDPGETLLIRLAGGARSATVQLGNFQDHTANAGSSNVSEDKAHWIAYDAEGNKVAEGDLLPNANPSLNGKISIHTDVPFSTIALQAVNAAVHDGSHQSRFTLERVEAQLIQYDTKLNLHGQLSDQSASEQLEYRITGLSSTASLNHGTQNADGSWTVTAAEAQDLHLLHHGEQHLQVQAVASVGSASASSATLNLDVTTRGMHYELIGGDHFAKTDEDAQTTVDGVLTIDTDATITPTFIAQTQHTAYGVFSLQADGHWSYLVDNAATQHMTGREVQHETFTVETSNGVQRSVTIELTGRDDPTVVGGKLTGDVIEGSQATATGTLSYTDVDNDPATIKAMALTYSGHYGSLDVKADGTWEYHLDPSKAASLNTGDNPHDVFDHVYLDNAAMSTFKIDIAVHGHTDGSQPVTVAAHDDGQTPDTSSFTAHIDATIADSDAGAAQTQTIASPPSIGAPDDTLQDYLQFADTSGHVDPGLALHSNVLSPVDDYLHAAGVSPDALVAPHLDLPPTEALIALASAADQGGGSHETGGDPDANLIEATDAVTHPVDDQNHHGT